MNKIDELVREMCPGGVEYVKLGDVSNISIGEFVRKDKQNENAPYPVYNGGRSNTGFYDDYNRTKNKIIISARGAAGFVNAVYTNFWAGNSCYTIDSLKQSVLWKFLYYFLKNNERKFIDVQQKGAIPAVSKKQVEEFKIPLLPLEIQERIVEILDKFTDLTKELNDELTLRKKQYEYYRDMLLTFDCTIDRIRIKDVADISRGQRLVKSDLSENGKYAVYQNAISPMGYYNSKNRNGGSVYLIGAGAAGAIGFSENDFWAADDCYTFECNEKITQKYLFYVLLNNQSLINSKVRKASIPRISRESIENIEIPLPSLDVQNRLVEVLDNFDALCNDLNAGLPAEIEARTKQYEYYRDKLLRFE